TPGMHAVPGMVEALRKAMSGSNFLAGLELWMAARADSAVRSALVPSERQLGKGLLTVLGQTLGTDSPRVRMAYGALPFMLRGRAVTGLLRENDQRADEIIRARLHELLTAVDDAESS